MGYSVISHALGSTSLFFKGGVDLLLHLLTNIKDLPVTKTIVKQSGMGKAIGSIEKHSICAGTPNETAIMDRVHGIKSAWNSSVKARKEDKVSVYRTCLRLYWISSKILASLKLLTVSRTKMG